MKNREDLSKAESMITNRHLVDRQYLDHFFVKSTNELDMILRLRKLFALLKQLMNDQLLMSELQGSQLETVDDFADNSEVALASIFKFERRG